MDFSNIREALLECQYDIDEGSDIIMIKPALSYLDIISKASKKFDVPIAAYNVSGEYSMIKFAVEKGLLSKEAIYESIVSIKRAGANIITTYFAKELYNMIDKY